MSRPEYNKKTIRQHFSSYYLKSLRPQIPAITKSSDGLSELADIIHNDGHKSVLVVCSLSLLINGGTDRFFSGLDRLGIDHVVYDDICGDPTTENVRDAAALLDDAECSCIAAIGGSSIMNCARAVSLTAEDNGRHFGTAAHKFPVYAVPTGCAAAYAAVPYVILIDRKKLRISPVISYKLVPAAMICDRSLALQDDDCTAALLTDCMEYYLCSLSHDHPEERKLVLDSCVSILGSSTDSTDMLSVSYRAGLGLIRSLPGNISTLAYSLSAVCDIPRSAVISRLTAETLEKYLYVPAACNAMAVMAVKCGLSDGKSGRTAAAQKLTEAVRALCRSNDVPDIGESDIRAAADSAYRLASASCSPFRPTRTELADIITSAIR